MQRTRGRPSGSPRRPPSIASQPTEVVLNSSRKRRGDMAELTPTTQPLIKAPRRSSRQTGRGTTSVEVASVEVPVEIADVLSPDQQDLESGSSANSGRVETANSTPLTRKRKSVGLSDSEESRVLAETEPRKLKVESDDAPRGRTKNPVQNTTKVDLKNNKIKRVSGNPRGRSKNTRALLDEPTFEEKIDVLPSETVVTSTSSSSLAPEGDLSGLVNPIQPSLSPTHQKTQKNKKKLINSQPSTSKGRKTTNQKQISEVLKAEKDQIVEEVTSESTEVSGNSRRSGREKTSVFRQKIDSKKSPQSKTSKAGSSKKEKLEIPISSTPGNLITADAVAVAEAEKQGVFTQNGVEGKPSRGRPRNSAKAAEKSAAKQVLDCTVGPNEEPNICTRCGNQPAGIDHFYRFHNGLLASEQQSFDFPARRKRWTFTVLHKKCKMHCQVPSCRKVLNSVTAMIYHEKICGVEVAKVACQQCGKLISSLVIRQHERDHLRVAAESELGVAVDEDESEAKKVEETEEKHQLLQGGRRKRSSAVAALKKLRSPDEDQEIHEEDDYEDDEDKYQPSGSDDDEGDEEDEEEDLDSTVSVDADVDRDDVDQATPTRRRLENSVLTGNISKLHARWRRSLEVLGYAKCESDNCDHMATSLSNTVAHHKACRSKEVNRRRLSCAIRACRFRCAELGRLVRHYIKNHNMNLTKAKEMSKEKKEVLPDWRPTQQEIDALHLFD